MDAEEGEKILLNIVLLLVRVEKYLQYPTKNLLHSVQVNVYCK